MEFTLKSAAARVSFAAACLLFALSFEIVSLRQYLAYRNYTTFTLPGLEKATRLDPWNSEYAHMLGRIYLDQEQDFGAAQSTIRRAIQLNPHNPRYYLDLANIDQVTGDSQAEEKDLERARAAEPTMPQVSWEVANLYLSRGDLPNAFRSFATVEENSPLLCRQAIQLSLRVQPNVDVLLQYIPRRVDTLSSLLQVLYEQRKLKEAAKVWPALVALRQPLDSDYVRGYLSALMVYDSPQIEQAQQVWNDFLTVNQEMDDYASTGNLVANGGFEHDVLGWGFDWQYARTPQVIVAQENGVFHSGSRSLSVSFDGSDIRNFGVFQYIPVKRNTRYVLRAFVRADNILGSSGPRLAVTAPYDFSQRLYTSDDILGTSLWSSLEGSFTTGADTQMVAVVLLRNSPYDPIKGHLWLDEVSITQEDGH